MAATCRRCGVRVQWVKSAAHDRPMPIDPAPNPAGNLVLVTTARGLRARVIRKDEVIDPDLRRMPHAATCRQDWPTP